MKSMISQTVFIIPSVFLVMASHLRAEDDSLWSRQISRVHLNQLPLGEAVKKLVALYREQYPQDRESPSYVIAEVPKSSLRVTMDLRNVPLGLAVHYMAEAVGCRYVLSGKELCLITDGDLGETTQILAFTPGVMDALALKSEVTMEQVTTALQTAKINMDLFSGKKVFSAEGTSYLFVTGNHDELSTMTGLWKLFERGLKIAPCN